MALAQASWLLIRALVGSGCGPWLLEGMLRACTALMGGVRSGADGKADVLGWLSPASRFTNTLLGANRGGELMAVQLCPRATTSDGGSYRWKRGGCVLVRA